MIRNAFVVLIGLLCGMVVMQLVQWFEPYFLDDHDVPGLGGDLVVILASTVAPAAGAAIRGVISGGMVQTSRPRLAALAIAVLVGGLVASTYRYVAPIWFAWFATAVNVVVPAVIAGALFLLVHRPEPRA
jgi:hypothetical protein